MNEETTPTPAIIDDPAAKLAAKFANQEQRFQSLECHLRVLRQFFQNHQHALSPFDWRCYGWDNEVHFDLPSYPPKEAKDIARAFGADGWRRSHNLHTCGSIDWTKEIDGVKLIISNAEQLKKELVESVRL